MSLGQSGERFEIESSRPHPTSAQAPRKRSCLWVALPVGCVVMLLVCGGGGAAIFYGAMSVLKSAEPFQTAVQLAQQNPEVQAILGENIDSGFAVQGSINLENDTGNVDMTIPVSGSLSSGQIKVKGQRENGQWVYDEILFTDSSGNQVDLLPDLQASESDLQPNEPDFQSTEADQEPSETGQ